MKNLVFILTALFFSFCAHAEWKSAGEAGAMVSAGNSRAESYIGRIKTKYVFGANNLAFDSKFIQAKQQGILSARSWLIGLRFERKYNDELSAFAGQNLEGDSFAGYLQRYNSDIGGKHYFLRSRKDILLIGEAGYRFTREHANNDLIQSYQKARIYTELIKFWSETVVSRFWVEYIPNFTDNPAWQLNVEASLSAAVTNVIAFKPAYLVKYNNKPISAATNKSDRIFTTSIVANF